MKVSIVGTGYVGLVTGAGLARMGHDVVCVDRDPTRVEEIKPAGAPIHEDGLSELLELVGTAPASHHRHRRSGPGHRVDDDLRRDTAR